MQKPCDSCSFNLYPAFCSKECKEPCYLGYKPKSETPNTPIKDSGERTNFNTGAV